MNIPALTALIIAITGLMAAVPAIIIAIKGNSTANRVEKNAPAAIARVFQAHEDTYHNQKGNSSDPVH